MSNEIELKIAIGSETAENMASILSDFHILKHQKVFLGNTYYDTEECYFAQRKMGLRVRNENEQFTMTLKTDGKVTGGLHIRPEYNIPLDSEQADIKALLSLSEFDFPANLKLQPIFSTNFNRQFWLIECGTNTEIEIALDIGQIEANRQILAICELEFELKCGEIQDLFSFVANLGFVDGVRLSSVSKAQRGYQLAKGHLPSLIDWIEKWRDFLKVEQSAVNSRQVLTALLAHEQQLIEETFLFGTSFFAQDFLKTVERIGAFFNLYHHYLESGKLLQSVFAEQIALGMNIDEELLVELQDANQYCYEQIRSIIRLHSETKNNGLAMQKLEEFLQQTSLLKRMINLLKLTVTENG